jgi:chorismate mutase/prephenate dehydratase
MAKANPSDKERLEALRGKINGIDERMVLLFRERMETALQIAQVKQALGIPIVDAAREREVVERAVALVCAAAEPDPGGEAARNLRGETALLMRSIIALSREYQRGITAGNVSLLPSPRKPAARDALCAFQGVPGAWSEQALVKLFPEARKLAVEFFEDVFTAVKEKRVVYGVVPIENSQTGAIGETYDLLKKHGCFIVGRTWIDIRQCLLAPAGVGIADIREVLSHPEGFKQCRRFLRGRGWELTACRNTAVAAETVAKTNDGHRAAIASRRAAELNGLSVLAPDIMDTDGNRTSFVVIAAEPEYDEKSDLISITFSTQHRAGALCETLMPFMAQGVNLVRIESRPATPDSYRFFAELNGNITRPAMQSALQQAAAACEYFEVIGCYENIAN